MNDLYDSIEEKKKKRKKRKKAGSESSKESSLRDWFGRKGAKGKKKGWVDCNSPDGKGGYKSCGRGSGEKRKKYPACRPTPGACKERGKGKSWGKKAKKKSKKNEELYMDLEQIIKEELEAVLDEKRKKKKKKKKKSSGKKDACYRKVKSRYKVWPSAYASGALVKCRKVGAKNWGNSKKESLEIMIEDELTQVLHEGFLDKIKSTLSGDSKSNQSSGPQAGRDIANYWIEPADGMPHGYLNYVDVLGQSESGVQGSFQNVPGWLTPDIAKKHAAEIARQLNKPVTDITKIKSNEVEELGKALVGSLNEGKKSNLKAKVIKALRDEGGAAGMDALKTHTKASKEEINKIIDSSNNIKVHEDGDIILMDSLEEKKKKKACKPSKGKRFAKRVNGKCRSFGQKGQAKGGGDRIRPGTKKGDAYCARSAKIKKCKNPPCANALSRKKWKCRGSKSMKEQDETIN